VARQSRAAELDRARQRGRLREWLAHLGEDRDLFDRWFELSLEVVDEEWPDVRANLERRFESNR
jgi:hypothetical protein